MSNVEFLAQDLRQTIAKYKHTLTKQGLGYIYSDLKSVLGRHLRDHFSDVTTEILLLIFETLDCSDLLNLIQTCKSFNNVLSDDSCWIPQVMDQFPSMHGMLSAKEVYDEIQRVDPTKGWKWMACSMFFAGKIRSELLMHRTMYEFGPKEGWKVLIFYSDKKKQPSKITMLLGNYPTSRKLNLKNKEWSGDKIVKPSGGSFSRYTGKLKGYECCGQGYYIDASGCVMEGIFSPDEPNLIGRITSPEGVTVKGTVNAFAPFRELVMFEGPVTVEFSSGERWSGILDEDNPPDFSHIENPPQFVYANFDKYDLNMRCNECVLDECSENDSYERVWSWFPFCDTCDEAQVPHKKQKIL